MKRLLWCLLLSVSSLCFLKAQGPIPMNKKVFREYFTQANLMLLENFYDTALATFGYIYRMDTMNANVNYKIGYILLQLPSNRMQAQRFLEKAVLNISSKYLEDEPSEKRAPRKALYYLGQALHINGDYMRAVEYFDKYKTVMGKKLTNEELADINQRIEWCYNAVELKKNPISCKIISLGDSINSEYPDYSPVITADESMILFTSRRPGVGGINNKTIDDKYYEDIWVSYRKPDGTWTQARSIGITINTTDNEATIGLSPDGVQLFIYKDDKGDGNIYFSESTGEGWSIPEKLGEDNKPETDINSPAWEPSACITADGNTIYFVSDRKGGYGGRDLYRVVRLPTGYWSKAINLGPTINTPFDEDAPFIHPDGRTMFFSSKGHKSMGGFDVFYAIRFDSGWAAPVNVGYPINTPDDDIFYVISADGKRAYYSSSKPGGLGESDIYQINLDISLVDAVVLLKGRITFNGGDSLPNGARITVTDMESGETLPEVRPNPSTGKYILILSPGDRTRTYTITYEADSVQPIVEVIKVEATSAYTEIEKAVDLKNINFESKTLGTISMSGTVKDDKGKTIPGAKIVIKDNVSGKDIGTYFSNSESGFYYFVLDRGKNYNVSFEADGYLFQSANVNVPKKPEYSEIKKDIVLEKIKVGAKVTLNNLFFDSGKSTLRKESNLELDKLVKILKDYPEISIEIAGHTDSKGDDKLNEKLSQARAQAVVNYLIKKGIDKKRLIAKGYGEKLPVAPNTKPDGKPNPEGMQLNRRVEFKIIE
ncbi:MAG: OmpA family protein [Bacteroidota bacterium]